MLDGRPPALTNQVRIALVTGDAEFENLVRTTFGGNAQIDLDVTASSLAACKGKLDVGDAKVVLVDLDADRQEEVLALQALAGRLGAAPPTSSSSRSSRSSWCAPAHARRRASPARPSPRRRSTPFCRRRAASGSP